MTIDWLNAMTQLFPFQRHKTRKFKMGPPLFIFQHIFLVKTTLIKIFFSKISVFFIILHHHLALCLTMWLYGEYYLLLGLKSFSTCLLRNINSNRIYKPFKPPVATFAQQSLPWSFGIKLSKSIKSLFLDRTQTNVAILEQICSKGMDIWITRCFFV